LAQIIDEISPLKKIKLYQTKNSYPEYCGELKVLAKKKIKN